MRMTICVRWMENNLIVARIVGSEQEAIALANEKRGIIERWSTITSGSVKIYGLSEN